MSVRCPDGDFSGRTENISRGGLCLELPKAIGLGQDVLCHVSVPSLGDSAPPLSIPARVVWCTRINDDYQLGLQWGPMERELATKLEQLLSVRNRPHPS